MTFKCCNSSFPSRADRLAPRCGACCRHGRLVADRPRTPGPPDRVPQVWVKPYSIRRMILRSTPNPLGSIWDLLSCPVSRHVAQLAFYRSPCLTAASMMFTPTRSRPIWCAWRASLLLPVTQSLIAGAPAPDLHGAHIRVAPGPGRATHRRLQDLARRGRRLARLCAPAFDIPLADLICAQTSSSSTRWSRQPR